MKSLLIAVLQGLLFAPLVGGTSFSYNNNMQCSDPAHISINSLGCGNDGNSDCSFGGIMTATGVLTLSSDLPDTSCVTVKACFMGLNFDWFCKKYEEKLDMCEYLDLMSDYSACPSAGSYAFQQSFNVPVVERESLGAGWWVKTTIQVKDCAYGTTYTTCTLSFDAVASSSSTYSFVNISAIGVAVLAALGVYAVRKRRVARIDLRHEEELAAAGQATSSFAPMQDIGVRV